MGGPLLATLRTAGFLATGFGIRPLPELRDLAPHVTNDPAVFPRDLETPITVVRDVDQTEDALPLDSDATQPRAIRAAIAMLRPLASSC